MYPGEGMYDGDEPVQVHRHHLPNMEDDDDNDHHHHYHHDHNHDKDQDQDDNDHSSDNSRHRQQHKHKHKHPSKGHTPPPHRHNPTPLKGTPNPTPSLRPQQPLQPPTPLILPQPLQPPTPILPQPPLQPPILLQQPPSSPPRKPQPPPPMDLNHPHHYNDDDLDDDKHKPPNQQVVAATVFIVLLLLLGLTFLILWLVYRPSKPHFSAVSALIYTLNTTTGAGAGAGATVAASMQFIIHTTNPNKRTTLSYDHLTATVYYRSTAITPPVPLPPLFHRKHSSVIIAPVIGGPPPAVEVPVGWEVANGLLSEEAYGVVGFSWVVVGRVRYRVGGFKSGHSRVYVKCDVVVKLTGVNNGVYVNSAGQVPLLASPPCLVDI